MFARCASLVIAGFIVIAVAACGDDDTGSGSSSGTTSTSATYCQAVPDGDSFCSCEVATAAPKDAIDTCNTEGSPNTACCYLPGTGGAGNGRGLCGCKTIACSEFSDGSCTCRTGEPSTEKPVESCAKPDDGGHCCKSSGSYCQCSASACDSSDEEVDSCSPIDMAKTACGDGESLVTDCKTALK